GTGAGKSTQIPKLYIYYLIAIDRISDPTVVLTIPRTNIATGGSDWVSKELAVPISQIDKNKKIEVRTKNKYIQFKYMKDDNIDNGNYPKIRFITDGTVLMDVKDPLLKNKRIVDNSNYFIYQRDNKYDVVIIDEAHEHNANMDMIISLIKNSLYYNNKLRFVIMSATMDEDEPIYRRFHREINDNRKYPLNNWIQKHNIDRVHIDRRFHISPPGEKTRFKITEYYKPNVDAENIIFDIINGTSKGDILLFRPGLMEIANSVQILNNGLPDNVIALPYHAQLPNDIKNFIFKIDSTIKELKCDKSVDMMEASVNTITNGNNNYTRCILVATNIAEASISIKTLRYSKAFQRHMLSKLPARLNYYIAI
ncbi:MAG TPA: hypothetical protein PKI46_08950, partial [Bacteroidales bacterium]|nr:hypothetical protein [Bacteroidales bacterium]